MDSSLRMTSRAVGCKGRESFSIHDGLSHDGPGGVTCAQEQDVVMSLHWSHLNWAAATPPTTAVLHEESCEPVHALQIRGVGDGPAILVGLDQVSGC
jgi:hypothetical protein